MIMLMVCVCACMRAHVCSIYCWLSHGVRSTPVLPQWHLKDPGHSAKKASGRLHLNMHIPLTQRISVGWLCCPGTEWEPIRETSSHATRHSASHPSSPSHCGLILACGSDSSLKNGTGVLISTYKEKQKREMVRPSTITSRMRAKSHHYHHQIPSRSCNSWASTGFDYLMSGSAASVIGKISEVTSLAPGLPWSSSGARRVHYLYKPKTFSVLEIWH